MTLRMTGRLASVGISALVIAGCASREAPPPPAPAAVRAAPLATALAPAVYMQVAASSALFAVRASEVAASRSSDPKVRAVARAIAEDQRGIGSQLNLAGRRLNLLPSAALTADQAANLDLLSNSTNVDAAYRQLIAPVLTDAYRAHAAFAARGTSPTLRPVAKMAAPATRRNLQQLQSR